MNRTALRFYYLVTDIITGLDFHMVTSEIPSRFYKPHAGIASYTQVYSLCVCETVKASISIPLSRAHIGPLTKSKKCTPM